MMTITKVQINEYLSIYVYVSVWKCPRRWIGLVGVFRHRSGMPFGRRRCCRPFDLLQAKTYVSGAGSATHSRVHGLSYPIFRKIN